MSGESCGWAGRKRLALAVALMAAYPVAWAQHTHYNLPSEVPAGEVATLEAQRQALFDRIQTDPADIDTAFAYAVLSTRLGDYEAAIGTYERLLVMHPETPRLQLELAALYFRLGSHAQARPLFDSVARRADTPPNVQMRIAGYLRVIDGQARQLGGFSGRASIGMRLESNANAAPDVGTISLNGLDFELSPESRQASDLSGQYSLALRQRQPFSGHGHLLDMALSLAGSEYRDIDRLESQMLEARIGPDFSLRQSGLRDGRGWVSAVGAQSWLDGDRYQRSIGAHAGIRWSVARQSSLQVSLDWRDETYTPKASMASAANYSGQRQRVGLMFSRQTSANWQWMAGTFWEQRDARATWESYREPRVQLGASHRYASPLGEGRAPWTVALTGHYAWRRHDAPMPAIDRLHPQRSEEVLAQLVNTIPLRRGTDIQLYVGWRHVDSTHDIRNYTNRFAGLTLAQQF